MNTEKLTEAERETLEATSDAGRHALRIIEAYTAALARVEETRKMLCMIGSMNLASRLANNLHMPELQVDLTVHAAPAHYPKDSCE